jgi:hypothetical protein
MQDTGVDRTVWEERLCKPGNASRRGRICKHLGLYFLGRGSGKTERVEKAEKAEKAERAGRAGRCSG